VKLVKSRNAALFLALGAFAAFCGYAAAQVGSAIFLGVQTSAANCTWSNAAVVNNGMALCPLNLGTASAPIPGFAIAVNQGAFTQVYPAPPPPPPTVSFSQVTGLLSASQLPSTLTCSVSATIGTSNTIKLSGCQ
jgi:hypothetical protein